MKTEKEAKIQKSLVKKIEDHSARVGVVGLGYVGLPLAVEFAKVGFEVTGIDVSSHKVEMVEAGKSDVQGVSEFEVAGLKAVGKLGATQDYGVAQDLDVVVMCVPTPLNKTRDPGRLVYFTRRWGTQKDAASRTAGGPGKHHLSRHDPGGGVAEAGGNRIEGGERCVSGLFSRTH